MPFKHGLCDRKLYGVWKGIKVRCSTKSHKYFCNYGGRGICFYEKWSKDFKSFYDFCISNGWRHGLQVDRIDNNGNYEPNNIQFITMKENCSIGKKRKYLTNKSGFAGVSFVYKKWVSSISINNKIIYLGRFTNIDDAVNARIKAEIKYLGKQITINNIH